MNFDRSLIVLDSMKYFRREKNKLREVIQIQLKLILFEFGDIRHCLRTNRFVRFRFRFFFRIFFGVEFRFVDEWEYRYRRGLVSIRI